jgi:hypothetical protein
LETALRHYDFIPESVFGITSVTTQKTAQWQTTFGHFSYRTVKPSLFFGYAPMEGTPAFLMAEPEKALLDMLYFNAKLRETADFEGLRLNQDEIRQRLNPEKMAAYLALFDSPALNERSLSLQAFLQL